MSISTMLLFTITPALAITPMPVITTPNGWPITSSPSSTPKVDITTAVSTRPTEVSLLNCASRIAKIRKIAVPNALSRKAAGLLALLVLALELEGDARPEIGLGELGATSCCTLAVCTPSATLAETVITRLPLTRLM